MDDDAGIATRSQPVGVAIIVTADLMSAVDTVTRTTQVADAVREAMAANRRLRIMAGRTWLDAGRPIEGADALDVGGLTGIVEYEPGDLTLTARAGTTLAEIADATRAHAQWLTLDPVAAAGATLGATVATASSGSLAHAYGGPRDNVIGLEFVAGDGTIARGGGRVVKNVAGFDLVRLVTGAWGTLGVITEVSVRLRAMPQVDETVAIPVAANEIEVVVSALRSEDSAPLALEMIAGGIASRLGLGSQQTLLVRLGGNQAAVQAQRDALSRRRGTQAVDGAVWQRLRDMTVSGHATLRISARAGDFATVWTRTADAVSRIPDVLVHASPARATIRVAMPDNSAMDGAESVVRELQGTIRDVPHAALIPERLPRATWTIVPNATDDALSREIRRRFDPATILNPGIL